MRIFQVFPSALRKSIDILHVSEGAGFSGVPGPAFPEFPEDPEGPEYPAALRNAQRVRA